MNNLEKLLVAANHLAKKRSLEIIETRHDEEMFGNSYVVLESSRVKFKFIYDRNQLFADVCPPKAEKYIDINILLNRISKTSRKNTSEWTSTDELISAIDDHYDELEALIDGRVV